MPSESSPLRQRHVFAVSDATGATCQIVVQAALSQFKSTEVLLERVPNVRTPDQVRGVVERAARVNGVVIYTMVAPDLRRLIDDEGRRRGIATVDVLGPILTRLSDLLEISPLAQPGLFRQLKEDYFRRIEAVDFTVKHDDGLGLTDLSPAEIVIVGPSRTAKTPVSMYLSYRGWKVANIPVVPGIPLAGELGAVDQNRIVAFTAAPEWLQLVREERERHLGAGKLQDYTDLERIGDELEHAARLARGRGWPLIDVSYKSIEETATEVMKKIFSRTGARRGPSAGA